MPLPEGWQITHLVSASSSNDVALDIIKQTGRQAHRTCIIVDEQTKGRGRNGRVWHSAPGDGLYLSAIYAPSVPQKNWAGLSFVTSLALFQAVTSIYPQLSPHLHLKWPNDLVTSDYKLAGILLEAVSDFVIIGCGVNLRAAPDIMVRGLKAGSLADILTEQARPEDRIISPSELGSALLGCLDPLLDLFEREGLQALLPLWRQECDMFGRDISLTLPSGMLTGKCEGIDNEGRLILVDNAERRHIISTGDVEILSRVTAS